jgi:hypothetical protein
MIFSLTVLKRRKLKIISIKECLHQVPRIKKRKINQLRSKRLENPRILKIRNNHKKQ